MPEEVSFFSALVGAVMIVVEVKLGVCDAYT